VSFEPRVPRAGETLHARVEARDPDQDPLRLAYAWRVNGRAVAQSGPELAGDALRKGFSVEVTVTASDGRGESAAVTAEAAVGNQPPRVRRVALRPAGEIAAGMQLSALVEARDPDGDELAYEYVWLVNGQEVRGGEPVFSTAGLRRGDAVRVRVVAADGRDRSEPVLSRVVALANVAPVINSQPPTVDASGLFRYAVEAQDPDDEHVLRFRLLEGPAGMAIDPLTGVLSWRATADQSGPHAVEIAVEDRDGGVVAQRFELLVKAQEAAEPPPASPWR
jgi:acyl dehydratase